MSKKTELALDGGPFTRMTGWNLCVPSHEKPAEQNWIDDLMFQIFQPKIWHSWGTWPARDYPGRIPMIWSSRSFDESSVRQYLIDFPACEWQMSNEPDNEKQANETPDENIAMILRFNDIAREIGNKYQWLSPAIMLNTKQNGIKWLKDWTQKMRQYNGHISPAAWCIHPYRCDSVAELRKSMSRWWTEFYPIWGHGAPVYLSEVCAEGAPDVDTHKLVMDECARMLQADEVQGVFWFSAYLSRGTGWKYEHYPLTVIDYEAKIVKPSDLGKHWLELAASL